MKPSIVPLLLCLGTLLVGIGSGFAADFAVDDGKKIPLGSVYTTTRQKDTKDAALAQLKDLPRPIFGKVLAGERVIFLVNGKDFPTAVKASRQFLPPKGDAKAADPTAETKADEQNWVGAYLGSTGSQPPAYRVLSVEVEGRKRKVRVTYEPLKNGGTTLDYYSYLVWAPLGKLSAGEYRLELYDAAAKKVMATRTSKVIAE
jgi:hypothetical protein